MNGSRRALNPTIVGLGMTPLGKVYGSTARDFAGEAVRAATVDAGLNLGDIDGLIVSGGLDDSVGLSLQTDLQLKDLRLLTKMQAFGSTAGQMIQHAAMAIMSGTATTVACVWADAPLVSGASSGASYNKVAPTLTGWPGLTAASGITSPTTMYALAAQRHMNAYGTTNDDFAAIAVAQRRWAELNPHAQFRTPLSLEEYHASRWIAEPFHLFDCCLVSNGGIAVIVTSAERARSLKQPPVEVLGWGQGHPGSTGRRNDSFGLVTGAAQSGRRALEMARTNLDEIDVVELYDCYTYTVLVSLEDYGFCDKGEGGAFVSEPGMLGPGGHLALNTGGGQLSSYYMWGMTPLSEGIIQARGQAGERQSVSHDRVLVSGNGGILDHHSTLILGTN
ncbi:MULTISPECIES: thiolase family protein [unclassified Salinibacterium]|uniref:thiolase family protein n=1 Tax=unclassified Salinibacterium TaxID=2632331 RepID=UPI0018CEE23E|nr:MULTISPECIES: thiolase family protein [unclassified Salinibacterium]MBH0023018.1 thiolase family protein [Salinibacterium sp. SWN248]MBH0053040.1 thiolase family protein [Salinibacterium sp. SWN139]MBH0082304.1 thiolase family protein [Salinibacterium sp. SWN167]